jgi:hypothetical protein
MITESVTIRYRDEDHRRFADITREFGFVTCVTPTMEVGLQFFHPTKFFIVEIEPEADPELEGRLYTPRFLVLKAPLKIPVESIFSAFHNGLLKPDQYVVPFGRDSFTEAEDRWVFEKDDDFQILWRELYLYVKVRPNTMNNFMVTGR